MSDVVDVDKVPPVPHAGLEAAAHEDVAVVAEGRRLDAHGGRRVPPPGAQPFPHLVKRRAVPRTHRTELDLRRLGHRVEGTHDEELGERAAPRVVRCHVPDDPVGLPVQVQFRLVLGRPFLLRDVVLRDVDQLTVNREVPRGHQHLADLGSPARHRRGLTRQEEEGEEDEEGLRGSAVQHAHVVPPSLPLYLWRPLVRLGPAGSGAIRRPGEETMAGDSSESRERERN